MPGQLHKTLLLMSTLLPAVQYAEDLGRGSASPGVCASADECGRRDESVVGGPLRPGCPCDAPSRCTWHGFTVASVLIESRTGHIRLGSVHIWPGQSTELDVLTIVTSTASSTAADHMLQHATHTSAGNRVSCMNTETSMHTDQHRFTRMVCCPE